MTDTATCLLDHLGVLAIDGPDAATFLQGQATCDTRQVDAGRGALGALCNLQGRMIVSFYVLPAENGLRLLLPRDRIDAVLTHLKKYAVFSKVLLADDAATCEVVGGFASGDEPFTIRTQGSAAWLLLRGGRSIGLAASGSATVDPARASAWRAAAVAAGELLVDTANSDRFLPQALNYDLIDGVSFKKGCYTGQEIVARMHFKGKMKERLYIGTAGAAHAPAANTAVVNAEGKTVGDVVAAEAANGQCLVGAVLRHEAVRGGRLHLGDSGGPLLVIGEQPVAFDRGAEPGADH